MGCAGGARPAGGYGWERGKRDAPSLALTSSFGRPRARFFLSLPAQSPTTGCFTGLCGGGQAASPPDDDTPGPRRNPSPSPAPRANGGTPAPSAATPAQLERAESAVPALHPAGSGSTGGGAGSSVGSGHARIGSGVDLHTLLSHVLPSKEAAIKVPPVAAGGEARYGGGGGRLRRPRVAWGRAAERRAVPLLPRAAPQAHPTLSLSLTGPTARLRTATPSCAGGGRRWRTFTTRR